ncbi:CRAL/TRIO domain [Popillia japonica]|uniref:CRAL/TRIO domain n=1 Tax=Popillia japonica TaxID=7064 RepID=A0AAW1LFF9_POPJA
MRNFLSTYRHGYQPEYLQYEIDGGGVQSRISKKVGQKSCRSNRSSRSEMGLGGQESTTAEYVCQLPEGSRKVALEELREDDAIREQSLAQMRDWIDKNVNIKNCRTDAPFLLRFLRTKKYSVPLACEMLERYLIVRQLHPDWFQKLDCDDPEIADIIRSGYLLALPERDSHGRTVIFSCAGRFDPHKYTAAQMIKVHSIITETLMDEEENQVNGYTYVNDESGLQMAHVSLFSLTDIRNVIKCIQHSSPMRHKQNHFLNISPSAIKLLEFSITFLNEKLKNRILLHKSYDDLYKHVNKKILPKEYGGEIPMQEMLDSLMIKLKNRRNVLLALDDMHIEISDKYKPFVSEINEELGLGVEGTFKKLQVD